LELVTELAGEHPDRRIFLGVVIERLVESFHANGELLQPRAVAGQRFFSQVSQEPAHRFGVAEHLAGKDLSQLLPEFLGRPHFRPR
jgi:hypothetical protein